MKGKIRLFTRPSTLKDNTKCPICTLLNSFKSCLKFLYLLIVSGVFATISLIFLYSATKALRSQNYSLNVRINNVYWLGLRCPFGSAVTSSGFSRYHYPYRHGLRHPNRCRKDGVPSGQGVKLIPARFRVPVSEFRNSGESETRLSESDGGQVYSLCLVFVSWCLGVLVAT